MTARRTLAVLACLVAACQPAPKPVLPMADSGELVVLTVNGPATYYEDAQGQPSGFEYDLVVAFAKELRVQPRILTVDDPAKIEPMIRENRAHLGAAALAKHLHFPGSPAWGPPYFTTQYQVVSRTGDTKPRSLADLADKSVGLVDDPLAEEAMGKAPPGARLVRMPTGTSTADLLEQVAEGRLDTALVDSNRYTLARRHFPQVEVAFTVGKPFEYAWLVGTVDRKRILDAAGPFFDRMRKDGTLKRLVDRHYGHASRINAVDAGTLIERVGTMLPKLRAHFIEAEVASGIDWRLIAALGYQESHWDAEATSPTGVRGLMMLTDETAERLQIKNRLDARDSIVGGARYLALLRENLSPRIPEPDRTWLALAAYNLGVGHLEDARILAQRAKLNPDRWQDVRQVLPRLAEAEHFQTTKHGYARGYEAQQLVDNVRNYYDILVRLAPREAPLLPAPASDPDRPDTLRPPQPSAKGTASAR